MINDIITLPGKINKNQVIGLTQYAIKPDIIYKYQSGSTQIHGQTSKNLLKNPTWNNFPADVDISKYKRLKFYITPSKHNVGLSTNNIAGAVIGEVSLIDAQIRSDITTYYSGSGIGYCINNDDRFMIVPIIVANNNGVWQYAFSTISLYDVTGTYIIDSWIYEIDGFYDDGDVGGGIVGNQNSGSSDGLETTPQLKTVNNESLLGTGNIAISGLPTVSSSDNGKILMVVDGQWQLVAP